MGAGITGFTKLFEVPFADNFDDVSGMDVIRVAFDAVAAPEPAALGLLGLSLGLLALRTRSRSAR